MPSLTVVIITALSYFAAFVVITDKVNQLNELRETADGSLQKYAQRWPKGKVLEFYDFRENFIKGMG